jgi:glycosyltransferase involved in cell wall biosynthesis
MLIDVTRLLTRSTKGLLPTGVDRVSLAYVRHYGPSARAVLRRTGRSFVLPRGESGALFRWLQCPTANTEAYGIIARGLIRGWNAQRVAGCFLFNTGHSGLEKTFYPSMLQRLRVRPVFMLHDLIPITHPEYSRPGELQKHLIRMRNMLALASGIVCNSQATLDEMAAFAKHTGQPMPPSVVAWLAPGMSMAVPSVRPLVEPYFVILGTIEPRKNHWLLLHVWRRLVERLGKAAPRLVIIGQRGWECENVVDLLERCELLKGVVIEHSTCTDAQLVTYLHHAQALLFPSFTEGYGMPLVEALALGVPVIASTLPVFQEIAGDIPEYIDPLDGKHWGKMVEEYAMSNSRSRAEQLRRIEGFKTPNWAEHFAKVDTLLAQLDRIVSA